MRKIGPRPTLPNSTAQRLLDECAAVSASSNKVEAAKSRYAAARRAVWFRSVVSALAVMSGLGQRCMYCSGSESGQIEHYRPKATHPEIALAWTNMHWCCGVCNLAKGDRFNSAVPPLNPIDDDPWAHFFIDKYGNLSPKWNLAEDSLDARSVETIALHALDRQALQECRQERLADLRQQVLDARLLLESGQISAEDLEVRALNWIEQPFQPDIADYFISGPGAQDDSEPFKWLVDTISFGTNP